MILFCLPYAGGSEAIYYKWKNFLNSLITLEPIELKGRGKRYSEEFYETLEDAVEDIFINIKDKIYDNDYAIYGHSMGSLLAYELYYKINENDLRLPKHIFFSGYKAPCIIRKDEEIHTLPDSDFMKKVISLGGTPEEVLDNQELLEVVIPIIKNDFKIIEKYKYKKRDNKILCDISILNGKQDSIMIEEILAWKSHTCGNFKTYNFHGNHFFINNNIEKITYIINNTLGYNKY
jgi:surfactin synthase thioesterase subunit